ncbi:unnamed protein product [Ixodes pacificus]
MRPERSARQKEAAAPVSGWKWPGVSAGRAVANRVTCFQSAPRSLGGPGIAVSRSLRLRTSSNSCLDTNIGLCESRAALPTRVRGTCRTYPEAWLPRVSDVVCFLGIGT